MIERNKRSNTGNTAKLVFFVFLIFCVVTFAKLVSDYIKVSTYKKSYATITESGVRYDYSSGSGDPVRYIAYKYIYNNEVYQKKENVTTLIGKRKGGKLTIYINSKNPDEIITKIDLKKDRLFIEFALFITILLGYLIFFKKKNK